MATSRAQQAAIAISKKAGKKPKSLPKAQFGNTGPGGTAVKNNINAKIAAGVGTVGTTIGLALERHRRKKAKRLAEKVKQEATANATTQKERYGGAKMKKGGKVPSGYHKMPNGKIMKNSAHKKK